MKPDDIWKLIRDINPSHPDFPVVVTFLARYARELTEKEIRDE